MRYLMLDFPTGNRNGRRIGEHGCCTCISRSPCGPYPRFPSSCTPSRKNQCGLFGYDRRPALARSQADIELRTFDTGGETGSIICTGTFNGYRVIGPGAFGTKGTYAAICVLSRTVLSMALSRACTGRV